MKQIFERNVLKLKYYYLFNINNIYKKENFFENEINKVSKNKN